ncbi:MAG: GGDEF domain-containing protein [Ruminococcus sp.]|nr:GGDEF domain-containing protein [Ruminococcus sp.]
MSSLNIAVIISGIDEEYQNTILSGIHEYASQNNINISHFIAFGGVLGNKKNDIGEFNIYNLINYDMLDGVVLLSNTISSPDVVSKIVSDLKESYIPVSCIDCDMEDFYYVGIDNTKAMEEMVRHIVVDHGIKELNLITGPDKNPENIMRVNAYKKVLRENNIVYDEKDIYHGSFRERDGIAGVEEFIRNGTLHRAVICANDATALGAIATLQQNGYRVPQDVIVTGFDNIFNARNYYTPITSVDRPLKRSGYIACEQVHKAILEIEQERCVILDTSIYRNVSCGCQCGECEDVMMFKKEMYNMIETYHQDVPMVNVMSCNLAESDDFDHSIDILKTFVERIKCEKFFLCLCDDWLADDTESINDNYTVEGYTEYVEVPLVYCNGKFGKLDKFPSYIMLHDLHVDTDKSNNYYFSPLHFNERCLGYSVVCNSEFPINSPIYHTWIINICNSIENIRKKICLENALKKLETLYVIDPLSQIYNRNGFHEKVNPYLVRSVEEKESIMIMFADMDGMKYINDNFGHKEGDSAIKNMAVSVDRACNMDEVCARFGGDEFIIFGFGYTEEKAMLLRDRIIENIDEYNRISEKPYKIAASIGWHIDVIDNESQFTSVITKADQKMYREKKKKPNRRK